MARIRSIKPEFFKSLTIGDLTATARLTFIGLWCYADDNGVAVDDARLIRAEVWPLDEAPEILQRIREDLHGIEEAGLIRRYEADGKRLLAMTTWSEHQKVSHPRLPRFPRPEDVPDLGPFDPPENLQSPPEDDQSPPEILRPEQGAGSREQGAGRGGEKSPPSGTAGASASGRTTKIVRPLPDDFALTDDMRAWAAEKTPLLDVDRQTERFVNHAHANGRKQKDWGAAWRNWMLQGEEYRAQRGGTVHQLRPAAGGARHNISAFDENTEIDI